MSNMPAELGITVGGHCFDDLDYADDTLIIVDSNKRLLPVLKRFEEMAGTVGMHLSWPKTKIQNLGAGPPNGPVTIAGIVVERVDEFIYLGSLQSRCVGSVVDVRRCMGIAAGSMRSVNNIWLCRRIKTATNLKKIQVVYHGNPHVWIRNLDAYQDKFQQSSGLPHAVSAYPLMCVRWDDFCCVHQCA